MQFIRTVLSTALLVWVTPACGGGEEQGEFESLRAAERSALAMIAGTQTADGTWHTDYTSSTTYTEVAQQLDVWTPVILVDLLAPVAVSPPERAVLDRARGYLERQIESNGLVRYEGLGSDLLPDSDDTALIWRVAPGDVGTLMPGVLEVLEEYRAQDGLYRIWLSPEGRTGHAAVGDDPNPADIQTQIHILQFLAIHAPAAARACRPSGPHLRRT